MENDDFVATIIVLLFGFLWQKQQQPHQNPAIVYFRNGLVRWIARPLNQILWRQFPIYFAPTADATDTDDSSSSSTVASHSSQTSQTSTTAKRPSYHRQKQHRRNRYHTSTTRQQESTSILNRRQLYAKSKCSSTTGSNNTKNRNAVSTSSLISQPSLNSLRSTATRHSRIIASPSSFRRERSCGSVNNSIRSSRRRRPVVIVASRSCDDDDHPFFNHSLESSPSSASELFYVGGVSSSSSSSGRNTRRSNMLIKPSFDGSPATTVLSPLSAASKVALPSVSSGLQICNDDGSSSSSGDVKQHCRRQRTAVQKRHAATNSYTTTPDKNGCTNHDGDNLSIVWKDRSLIDDSRDDQF